ncbi:ARM repeat-containing protein [Atractiella rhizophila]|nr:ARM repeat-containing protein [Atractiella rhizophila]
MDKEIIKGLLDKQYDRRKKATQEIEKTVRELVLQPTGAAKINEMISQLAVLAASPDSAHNARIGGAMGLASVSLALGPAHLSKFLGSLIPPISIGLRDSSNSIRYFDLESMYNVTKVAKGDILPWFNELFDALSVLVCDHDAPVRSGTELLDRLLKDIVAEQAASYISPDYEAQLARESEEESEDENEKINLLHQRSIQNGIDGKDVTPRNLPASLPHPYDTPQNTPTKKKQKKREYEPPARIRAFNLERFIPLLKERLTVLAPPTQMFLCSWISLFNSIPDLSLVNYLPSFMPGLLKYLGNDISIEVVQEALALLGQFLREIELAEEYKERRRRRLEDLRREREEHKEALLAQGHDINDLDLPEITEDDLEDDGWVPEQLNIDHEGIVDALVTAMELYYDDVTTLNTILKWLHAFLRIAPNVLIPFIPRLIPFILKSLSHDTPYIREAAARVDADGLRALILSLPDPAPLPVRIDSLASQVNSSPSVKDRNKTASPTLSTNSSASIPFPSGTSASSVSVPNATKASVRSIPSGLSQGTIVESANTSVDSLPVISEGKPPPSPSQDDQGPKFELVERLDWDSTIHALHVLFVHDNKKTRVAAMEWLMMLHQKAPTKITASGPVFPSLLTCLSDESDEVIMTDLRLVAQILGASPEDALRNYLIDLLKLLASDRRLLETRGTLIIRLLCEYLATESVYKMLAELLEKDVVQDLDFCSTMVQNLTMILLTTPEMGEFRRKLKNLDTRDGQVVFTALYRSWSHNAVATFALCLLAQAYEHAANLLQTFGDLEVTVNMLIQIDKFVSLLESPVFTALRLQLLEPEKYPYLFKALYGLLMLLPQSSAFTMLRNRLNSVSALGFLHAVPRGPYPTPQPTPNSRPSTLRGREDLKWNELLSHFRTVQLRHERSRGRSNYYDNEVYEPSFTRQYSQIPLEGPPQFKAAPTKKKSGSTPQKSEGAVGNFLSAIQPRRRFPSLKR